MKTAPEQPEPESLAPESLRGRDVPQESATVTPRSTSAEQTPIELHPEPSAPTTEPSKASDPDTLISAPRPAEREELSISDRFQLLEDRVDEFEARMRLLERARAIEPTGPVQRPWWIWLIFLLGLAATWRLLVASSAPPR